MGTELMTRADHTDEAAPRRVERFRVAGPVGIDVSLGAGDITVHLAAAPEGTDSADGADVPADRVGPGSATDDEVVVELEHDPAAGGSWADGMHAMLNLFGSQFAEQFGGAWRANPDDAVTGARVEPLDGRILVHASETPALRNVPLAITIHAPADSGLAGKTSTADITVTGRAGGSDVSTSSGAVTVAELVNTSDRCHVRTGSGHVRLGTVAGGFDAQTSSGAVEVTAVSGSASATTGAGAVWFGEVTGAVFARTGSGSIAVADARSGTA